MTERVACPVVFASEPMRSGEFANAFRVMADSSGDALLDFCVYSPSEGVARVVARVRVAHSFLGLLDARIREAIAEFAALPSPVLGSDDVLVFPDGLRFMLGSGSGETH